MVKHLFLAIFFAILVLLESSFLVHFNILGRVPALCFIGFFLFSFFDKDFWPAPFLAGFFLDIFSQGLFGKNIIILLLIAIFLKIVCSSIQEKNIFWFTILFLVCLAFYSFLNKFSFNFVEMLYNLTLAIFGFFLINYVSKRL